MSRQREQRLQAIYDAFDARNYKGAIKLSNAAIQKYPDQPIFKALKGVALDRTGRHEEALQMVEEVLALAPPDDNVLHMLLLVLKPAKRAVDLQKAYEEACSKDPNSAQLLQGLFGCHVRSFDFQAQQQVAMKLNKMHPNELYQWWIITTIALQAHEAAAKAAITAGSNATKGTAGGPETASATAAAPGLGADKLLQLAEAMAARLLGKHTGCCPPSWESAMLYLGLLQAQGKYDAALAALRGNLGKSISLTAERRETEAALLLAKGDLSAAADLYEQALQEQPDDWALLQLYLDCLLPGTACTVPAIGSTAVAQMLTGVEASTVPGVSTGGLQALLARMSTGESDSPSVQGQIAKATAFITSLPTTAAADTSDSNSVPGSGDTEAAINGSNGKTGPLLRGPALAVVELVKRRLQLGQATQQELADAVLVYQEKLGHLVSCAMDLSCYLSLITGDTRADLTQQLAHRAEQAMIELKQQQEQQRANGGISNKAMLKLLRRQMAARQMQADLGGPVFGTAAAAQQFAQQLLQLYATYLPFYEGLDERERGPADELLWLAAAALIQAAALTQGQQSQDTSSSGTGQNAGRKDSSKPADHPLAYMLQALLALEAAAKGRPYCAPVRLGLTGLHGVLGNPKAAADHFFMLDVKHIQHDTLSSHHLLPILLGLGVSEGLQEVLGATLRLFEDHMNGDAGESLMQAFERGSHTKVLEFVCFKERLERSYNYVLARAEQAILSLSNAAMASADAAMAAAQKAVSEVAITLLDSLDWQGMRYNDDLTTRVPWLPPLEGARHLQLLLWWEQQQQRGLASDPNSSRASQQQWWKQVSAAEADLEPAAQYRAALQSAAKQRWLLPHLIAAAIRTSGQPANAGSAAGPQQLLELLRVYAASISGTPEGLQQQVQQCFSGQKGAGVALSRQLQLLDSSLFLLAQPVQDLLAAATAADAAPSEETAATCASICSKASLVGCGLQQLQQQVCEQLQPSQAYLGSMLPGHTLSAAVMLVSSSCMWIIVCLEAWSKTIKQVRSKKKTKKGSTAATSGLLQEAPVQEALQALAAVQAAVSGCLQGVTASCKGILANKQSEVEANLLAEFDPSSNHVVQDLVGWEERVSVQHVLVDAIRAQRQVLEQIKGAADKLAKRAQHVAW